MAAVAVWRWSFRCAWRAVIRAPILIDRPKTGARARFVFSGQKTAFGQESNLVRPYEAQLDGPQTEAKDCPENNEL